MKTCLRVVALGLGWTLVGLAACGSPGGSSHGGAATGSDPGLGIVIAVTPQPDGTFSAQTTQPAKADATGPYPYPGVTCYLANGRVQIAGATVSPDGKSLTLTFINRSGADFGMVWLLLDPGGAALTTAPAVDGNAAGDKVFVIGPLAHGASRTLELSFAVFGAGGYKAALKFLDVRPRIAYSSNRTEPDDDWIRTIYSLDSTGADGFDVTPGTKAHNLNPVWSPGGEWIAFEQMPPAGTPKLPTQIIVLHPDGSEGGYGGQINHDLYLTSFASFNPTGELMAFTGRLYDQSNPDTTYNVYLYDIKTRTRKIWFPGAPYDFRMICSPRWSPDGNYVIMNTFNSSGVVRWMYARVDPLTGDTVPIYNSLGARVAQPVAFASNGLRQTLADGVDYNLRMFDWTWGPDSRHAAVRCDDYTWTKTLVWNDQSQSWDEVWVWVQNFGGVAMIDFQTILGHPAENYPFRPEFIPVVYGSEGECYYTGFDPAGSQLWYYNSLSNTESMLQYTPLTDYLAPDPHARVTFISDRFYNFTPALWPGPRPEFFPPAP